MYQQLHIIHLEDNPVDAELVLITLQQEWPDCTVAQVDSEATYVAALDGTCCDLILADFSLPLYDGISALAFARRHCPDIPFIFVSGTIGEEKAIDSLKSGATDYVLKNRLNRLIPAVRRALKEKQELLERRTLEEQFRQSQKMEAIGQLAGGVAHDFNNIMQVIMGNAQLQLMYNQDHGVDSHYLDEIFKAVARGSSLTKSLLVFSRRQPLDLSRLDLTALIRESVNLALRLVTEDIVVTVDLSPTELWLLGDAGLVQQILFNLVTNARDAIGGQGHLGIRTAVAEIDDVFLETRGIAASAGRYALLSVSDDGCGIDDAIRERIFDPFFTTKVSGKGTGLGLAMIYGTVSSMNGFITLDSTPGHGSEFTVHLPLVEDTGLPDSSHGPDGDFLYGRGELILVTEDDQGVRDAIAQILTLCNYRVVEAASADEAIKQAETHKDDIGLALLDIILPGMNGPDALMQLRAVCPGLPALFLTGYSDEVLADKGITGGHLHKPVHPAQLLQQVRRLLDASSNETGKG